MIRPPATVEADALEIWDDLLRAYAETVELQRSFLLAVESADAPDQGVFDLPVFEVPDHVPPMPTSLEPWARSLVGEVAGLVELARRIVAAPPADRRPTRFEADPSGSMLDQKI